MWCDVWRQYCVMCCAVSWRWSYPEQLLILGVVLIRTAIAVAHTPVSSPHNQSARESEDTYKTSYDGISCAGCAHVQQDSGSAY